jgi:hypothetical protein
MTMATYFSDVVINRVQTTSERMPSATAGVVSPPAHSIAVLKV